MVTEMKQRLQKGLSLIEASMVLVLSAVVVAGVMLYYQTAEKNNQLDRFSTQIMHILSEINGLYAGASRVNDGVNYTGLDTSTVLNAVSDAEKLTPASVDLIKTAFPGVGIFIATAKKLPSTSVSSYDFSPTTDANRFTLALEGMDVTACQKLVGMNFGPQLEGLQVEKTSVLGKHSFNPTDFIAADKPVSERFKKCQDIVKNNVSPKPGTLPVSMDLILIMK